MHHLGSVGDLNSDGRKMIYISGGPSLLLYLSVKQSEVTRGQCGTRSEKRPLKKEKVSACGERPHVESEEASESRRWAAGLDSPVIYSLIEPTRKRNRL